MNKFESLSLKILAIIAFALIMFTPSHAEENEPPSSLRLVDLRCESLTNPIGLDTPRPLLSWKLQDRRIGARQTAYQVLVASNSALLAAWQADVWDSGRIESDRSAGIPYAGPALVPEKRYYWRMQVWDKDGKPYPPSDESWWETGLLDAKNWHGKWISYEDSERRQIRKAGATWIANPQVQNYTGNTDTHHDFLLAFDLSATVKAAILYVTGEESAAAWVNGKQILEAQRLPPWGRPPWRTYKRKEITAELHPGKNLVAVQITLYAKKNRSQTPMSSSLYLEMADGTVKVLATGNADWRAVLNAQGDWFMPQYDHSSWPRAVPYVPTLDYFGKEDKLGNPLPTAPVAALRHSFNVSKPVTSARLYATALGAYKISLNGKAVGDQVLSPGWTDYRQRVPYQTFDVTSLVREGKNAIGAYLAPGWYATPLEWIGQGNNYGETPPALRAQLRIAHTDGSVEWVITDESWKADVSPITFAEIYDGETYDARRMQPGWDTASFSEANWSVATVIQPHDPEIVSQSFPPIRFTQVLTAKSITRLRSGTFIYDFGQNLAGVARLRVRGRAGTDVRLSFAEILNSDGTIYVENLRNARATDHYILNGQGVEEYQPSFTFHGFRYVEVSGPLQDPGLETVKAVVMHTDAPITARLVTGSAMVNQLWNNILWGQRSNFIGVPTDCPQRDERLGWAADAQVFWRTASFNMDLTEFSRKYATDLRGTQDGTTMYGIYAPGTGKPHPAYAAGWSDAGVIVPWTSWIQSGDSTIIEQNWDAMKKYLAGIQAANPDYLWKNDYGISFGDWLAPEGPTSETLVATAYWAYDVALMEQMAHALGRSDDERKYAEFFQKIKLAFEHAYVRPDGFVGETPVSTSPLGAEATHNAVPLETQTGYVLALHMNLLPDSLRPLAARRLVDRISRNGGLLATGFLGTPYLLEVLTDNGHADVAYQLLLSTQYPSWGYMVEHGATTMWERWNGDQMRGDPGMNSYNHYAYGAVDEWIYRYAAGIDTVPEDPGFHTIFLHPNFDVRLRSLEFSYESPYGTVRSAWTATAGEAVWNVTVPPNTTARLLLSSEQAGDYRIDGNAISHSSIVRVAAKQDKKIVYELPAGLHSFKVKMPQQ